MEQENKPSLELTFNKPEDFLTQDQKIDQVTKVLEGLTDLERKYKDQPEMLDQIRFRMEKQKATLEALGGKLPEYGKREEPLDMDTYQQDTERATTLRSEERSERLQ